MPRSDVVPEKGGTWSEEARALIMAGKQAAEERGWPSGAYARPARSAFCALMSITGKPSLARKLMDELELWTDDRRPPDSLVQKWAKEWREGSLVPKPKVLASVQKQYDGLRRADMDESIRTANEAHRAISRSVIEQRFDKDTSGALQHLGQFIAIGTEKRQNAFEPRAVQKDGDVKIMPTFVLAPPPERKQLDDGNTVAGEVISRG